MIYAIRPSDGAIIWQKQLNDRLTGELLVVKNTLFAVSSHPGQVYALRKSDGKELWHYPGILSSHILLPNKVIVTDGKVYLPMEQQGLIAVLRVSDGRLLHTLTFHSDALVTSNYIEIAFANGVLYINSAAHDLYALRTSDDTTLWHKHFSDLALYGLSAAYNGTLYFAATSVSVSSISIVDTSQHVTPTPSNTTSVASTDIYAINANDGSRRWHLHPTHNDGYASVVLAMDENVYLSVGGRLYALSEKDGRQLWTISEGTNLGTPYTA